MGRRRARIGGIRVRPRYKGSRPKMLVNTFLQDFRDGMVDPFQFVFVKNVDGRITRSYAEKKRGIKRPTVKVSDNTIELLREKKDAIRGVLDSYEVYNIRRGLDPRQKSTPRRWVWIMEHTWAYFNTGFVENSFVIEKHLGRYPGMEFPEDIESMGKADRNTSIEESLKDRLMVMKNEYGYHSMDHLLSNILTRGEGNFKKFLGELGGGVWKVLRYRFGIGELGDRIFITSNAERFLKDWYEGFYEDPAKATMSCGHLPMYYEGFKDCPI